jgi:hypothetical protein
MTGELQVDTALLRAAADTLDDASGAFGRTCGRREGCPLSDDSLGDAAVAREVIASASRRVEEALQAAALCAGAASETAERVRGAATSFELVEATAGGPPR